MSNRTARITGADIVRAAAEFDKELIVDSFVSPPAKARSRWKRAVRKRGRPKKGRGAKVISVSVERELLKESDELARLMDLTRAELVARGLRAVLAAEGRR